MRSSPARARSLPLLCHTSDSRDGCKSQRRLLCSLAIPSTAALKQAEKFLRPTNVLADLRAQFVRRCEFLFVAQSIHEFQLGAAGAFRHRTIKNEGFD